MQMQPTHTAASQDAILENKVFKMLNSFFGQAQAQQPQQDVSEKQIANHVFQSLQNLMQLKTAMSPAPQNSFVPAASQTH